MKIIIHYSNIFWNGRVCFGWGDFAPNRYTVVNIREIAKSETIFANLQKLAKNIYMKNTRVR